MLLGMLLGLQLCEYVCVGTLACVCIYARVRLHMCASKQVHASMCMHVYGCMCVSLCAQVCARTYMCEYYMCPHVHSTHIHTHERQPCSAGASLRSSP